MTKSVDVQSRKKLHHSGRFRLAQQYRPKAPRGKPSSTIAIVYRQYRSLIVDALFIMMLKILLPVIFTVFNGLVWYSTIIGFGNSWAANAWPGKCLTELGAEHGSPHIAVSTLGNTIVVICTTVLIR